MISANLMTQALKALQLPHCKKFLWCDSKVVMQGISNPDLRLDKFTSRRVDQILLFSQPSEWHSCPTEENPADVATRPLTKSISHRMKLWLCSGIDVTLQKHFICPIAMLYVVAILCLIAMPTYSPPMLTYHSVTTAFDFGT